jgi:uncharacterized protein (UPF0335 family)
MKPPIGIMPKHIWEYKVKEERLKSILSAMERFEKENKQIPNEWFSEYLELTTELKLYKK